MPACQWPRESRFIRVETVSRTGPEKPSCHIMALLGNHTVVRIVSEILDLDPRSRIEIDGDHEYS